MNEDNQGRFKRASVSDHVADWLAALGIGLALAALALDYFDVLM